MVAKSRNALSEEIILISRGIAIYKVGASPYWQCRVRDARTKKYVVRSTKETSRIKARLAAEEIAAEIRGSVKRVERQFTFEAYGKRMIQKADRMVANGERHSNYARDIRYCLENEAWGLYRLLGQKDVREIRTREYQEAMDKIQSDRPDLSTSTRNILTATFRNVLKVARDDGVIDAVPATPRAKQKDAPRSYFPFHPLVAKHEDVYKSVIEKTKELGEKQHKVRGIPITDELYDLVLFLTHSFVRPTVSEVYALRHSDITVATDPRRLLITVRAGKTGYRVANSMPGAVSVYERILRRYPDAKPSDHLFYPHYGNRETAARNVQKLFRTVLDEAGIKDDPSAGIKYTIYSLRHTAICMRLVLSHGEVNIYNLAKNAGTSVEQIERFYARQLPLSREMAINLQKFGGQS
ncbi:integrase [Novosphingobium arvoryzae]|uniref:Phage integrase family protein n=1 Tax=Novosphingobium arvoryzae TaxID=1256514 RepID=A0A918VJB8_9SPHN|nr:integrase [Novosphingobium arvoryzae]GHA03568.1 hypothetical protein GCM10011617_25860 [Novosphingobium arvoryzae]